MKKLLYKFFGQLPPLEELPMTKLELAIKAEILSNPNNWDFNRTKVHLNGDPDEPKVLWLVVSHKRDNLRFKVTYMGEAYCHDLGFSTAFGKWLFRYAADQMNIRERARTLEAAKRVETDLHTRYKLT